MTLQKIKVMIITKQKGANMSETENTKDKSNETKSIKENPKALPLKRNKPMRPQRLPSKTGYAYTVNLPTYDESQARYAKFLCTSN